MNTHNRDNTEEGAGASSVEDRRHDDDAALGGNPYARRYQAGSEPEPDLDAGAPQLRSSELRRINQRALLFLAGIVLLLIAVAIWMFKSAAGNPERPKPREEKVTVAEAPVPMPMPRLPSAPRKTVSTAPIPLMPHPAPPLPTPEEDASVPRKPTLLERRIEASDMVASTQGAPAASPNNPGVAGFMGAPASSQQADATPLVHPDTLMQRGTYIRCVLETRIISDIPGFSTCLVSEPVYSFNGHTLLLPKGSKILGKYQGGQQQRRVSVIWDRIITPTGIDVNMSSPGMDQLGGAGLPGHYDAHWGSRIGAALMISLLSDAFKYEAAEHGPTTTTVGNGFVTQEPFQSNTAQTVQSLANQAVQEAVNRAPTVTLNQGTVIYIYVAQDVDFSGVVERY